MQPRTGQFNRITSAFRLCLGCFIHATLLPNALIPAQADELDCWIWRNPRPHNQQVFALTHGGGLWLSLGNSGTIATSVDGADWDLTTIGVNSPVVAGAYGDGRYVVSAPSRGVYTSGDGHNWAVAQSNPGLRELTFGHGLFVGVSGMGVVWTSTNGAAWTSRQLSFTHSLSRLSFANGVFFALGIVSADRNEYFLSSNGQDWSNAFSLGTNGIDKIVYGNGVYLGLRTLPIISPRSEFRLSTDGNTWSPPIVFGGYQINDVVFAEGRFFAIETAGRILVSTDGVGWTEHSRPELFGATELAWAQGIFVTAGVFGEIAASPDGLNWTKRSIGSVNSLLGISSLNGILVAVGGPSGDGGANLSKSTVATSVNGKDWMESDPGSTNSLTAAAFGSGRYVVVGTRGTIITSPDANQWTTVLPLTTNALSGVAYGNGRFVAVGGDATRATVLTSSDGVNWSAQANAGVHSPLYGVTFGGNQFVAVGRTNALRQGTILSSPDGLNWTARVPTTTNSFRAVAYHDATFVAVGDRGAIVNSPDGANWTDLSRNTTRMLRGVAHGGGWWVIITDPVGHYSSQDGLTWTFRGSLALTTQSPLFAIASGGDSFYVAGIFGGILESFPFNPPPTDTLLRLRYSDNLYLSLSGLECHTYEIQARDVLSSEDLGAGMQWERLTTVSNWLGTVTLPVGTSAKRPSRFYRALRIP